eukprot:c2916_g1_i1.p1 GENE.c2916_g1_i1~~c2916_g1_i1.p1  ORF type:complete len:647 (+),score=137.77 c2916_g1_i1:1-1941(+)
MGELPPMSDQALQQLNAYLSSHSYLAGYVPSSADLQAFEALGQEPSHTEFPHVSRFYRQIASFSHTEREALKSVKPTQEPYKFTYQASGARTSSSSAAKPQVVDPYSNRVFVRTILNANDGQDFIGQTVRVGGWVKSGRDQKQFAFIALNDGSTPSNLQVVVSPDIGVPFSQIASTGASLLVEGEIKPTPDDVKNAKQLVELHATKILSIGQSDPSINPISKTKLKLEYLRGVPHLRPRTNTISAIVRIRNALSFATHEFFQKNGFLYIHTPILTSSDCEGAGEMFNVTTLLAGANEAVKNPPKQSDVPELEAQVAQLTTHLEQLKVKKAKELELQTTSNQLGEAKKKLEDLKTRLGAVGGIPRNPDGTVDYSKDFFGKPAFLTVSGQLQVESFACSMSSVYTFGPTFRAEYSHTSRHLAEFWMIEPEISFCDLWGDMKCAEDYVRYCCKFLLDNCYADMEFMKQHFDQTCIDRVKQVVETPFKRLSYTEAIELLKDHIAQKKVTFIDSNVFWGMDLASEHERYICEKVFCQPVIVYNYPKEIKAFYMKVNEDGKTVAAMDMLVPGVGELIGGSQREERLEVLENRITEMGLDVESYRWYLDFRRFGSVVHSGFGLGFERLVLFTTGLENIRDVIPFPRWHNHCDL